MTNGNSSFPRGLVLGLTMAEVFILIIFVLLLAFAALLERETERRKEAQAEAEETQEDLNEAEEERNAAVLFIEKQGLSEAFAETARESGDLVERREQRRRDEKDAIRWRELVAQGGDLGGGLSPEAVSGAVSAMSEASAAGVPPEDFAEAARAVAEAAAMGEDGELSPTDIVEAAKFADAVEEALRERGEEPTPEAVPEVVRDAERWRERAGQTVDELAADLERAHDQIERLRAQARSRGRGGMDYPSCVYRDGRRAAYLFDVGLVEGGYLLKRADIASDPEEIRRLPLGRVETGRILSRIEFQRQTQEIYDWSVEEECRFFVRAFDHTAEDQKALYKSLMTTLESRFYKFESAAAQSPFDLPPTPRRSGPGEEAAVRIR